MESRTKRVGGPALQLRRMVYAIGLGLIFSFWSGRGTAQALPETVLYY